MKLVCSGSREESHLRTERVKVRESGRAWMSGCSTKKP